MSDYEPSNAEAALMGLLAEEPKYPYQIEKNVEYRDMRSWTDLSMSSIYKLLRKLEDTELVNVEIDVTEGNRARKVYQLTEAGRDALERKIRSLLRVKVLPKDPFNVAIYNSDLLMPDEVESSLRMYREHLAESIEGYVRLEQFLKDNDCPPARIAVATRPRHQCEGEMVWLDEYLQQLESSSK
ncbi:MAG: PadR family transcriptional regulator [Fidelibacterota bacterium]|nr:MAG: PadR family transcriptional regulator [Candidatus Neomarinimicrobiota bacterium]